jgi:chromosome segregation ATPase
LDKEFRQVDATAKQGEQEVTNASQEVSRLQHKREQMTRMLQTLESEVSEQTSHLATHKKQAERLESQVLPPVEGEIAGFVDEIGRLQDEIGTELTSSLSDEDRNALTELKEATKELQAKITRQTETVDELRVERGRVASILEDNLLKRRQELTQAYKEDESGLVATTTNMLQEQKQRELEDRRQQLLQATKDMDEIDSKLDQARQAEEELKGELIAAKNELEKLKGQDMKNSKLLDEASERSEKLMSKVSILLYAVWILFC